MTASIERVSKADVQRLISLADNGKVSLSDQEVFENCLLQTADLWVGIAEGALVCVWGLIPPTLMSDQAYLWLYTTEAVKDNEFIFVRWSQRAVEVMLALYPTIVGHCSVGAERSIRWLKWLGAEFGDYEGRAVPFVIRKKS